MVGAHTAQHTQHSTGRRNYAITPGAKPECIPAHWSEHEMLLQRVYTSEEYSKCLRQRNDAIPSLHLSHFSRRTHHPQKAYEVLSHLITAHTTYYPPSSPSPPFVLVAVVFIYHRSILPTKKVIDLTAPSHFVLSSEAQLVATSFSQMNPFPAPPDDACRALQSTALCR